MPYPSTVGTLTDPQPTDRLNSPSHSGIEQAQNTNIEEIQTFVGTTSSAVGTLIYDIRSTNSNGGGHVQTANKGGTGQTTFTKGDILVAQSSSVLSKFAVGGEGQVLVANSATNVGVQWGSVAGVPSSVISFIPRSGAMEDGHISKVINSSITGVVGQVYIPFPISASTLSIISGDAITTAGTVDVTLYKEDGTSSVLTVTTPAVSAIKTVYTASTGPKVNIPAGNYYAMINPNADTNVEIIVWKAVTNNPSVIGLEGLAGQPILKGVYSIVGGTPPASIVTTAITAVSSGNIPQTSNTPFFRLFT